MKKINKSSNMVIVPFNPCITNPRWFVSRIDVVENEINHKAVYIFGIDGIDMTLYNKNNPNFQLSDLAVDTLIKHLEKNPDDIEDGLFWFEFNGEKFDFCKNEPEWANYDCGYLEK